MLLLKCVLSLDFFNFTSGYVNAEPIGFRARLPNGCTNRTETSRFQSYSEESRGEPVTRRSILHLGLAAGVGSAAKASDFPLEIGGASIEVAFEPERYELPQATILKWVDQCASAVSGYYGGYPVPKARVLLRTSDRRGVSNGKSFGGRGVVCRVAVNPQATREDLQKDWILTHEMVHFGFPSVARRHHWIEEGTATYVEPLAPHRAGIISVEQVWSRKWFASIPSRSA